MYLVFITDRRPTDRQQFTLKTRELEHKQGRSN